jgi:hypothetical protein
VVVRSFMAHHQAMILLSVAHVLLAQPMQKRFESDPRFKATLLLLQERVPKAAAQHAHRTAASDGHALSEGAHAPVRVFTNPDSAVPEVQLLSNGRYHVMVTHAGGGQQPLEGPRRHPLARGSHVRQLGHLLLHPRHGERHLLVERAPAHAPARGSLRGDLHRGARGIPPRRRRFRVPHGDRGLPEDDVELRRVRITNRSRSRRTIDVTSYAEVVLAPPAADTLHPAFSNLFVQTQIVPERQAILCTRRPRSRDEPAHWMFHLMAVHGVASREVSYETDRMAFIGRGRTVAHPYAMDNARLGGAQGSVLDPIVAIRHLITLEPQQDVTIDIATGVSDTRAGAPGICREVPGPEARRSRLRSGLDARRRDAAPDQRDRGRRAALLAPCLERDLRQRVAAGAARRALQEPPRAVGPVELRDSRRPADRAGADRRCGEHRPRAAAWCRPMRTGA